MAINRAAAYFLRHWSDSLVRYEEADQKAAKIKADYLALTGVRDRVTLITWAKANPARKEAIEQRDNAAQAAMVYGLAALVELTKQDHLNKDQVSTTG